MGSDSSQPPQLSGVAQLTPARAEALPEVGGVAPTGPPVFIVGFPRSGTTLVRAILASHPDLAIPPESHFIPILWQRRGRYERAGSFDRERFLHDLHTFARFRDWDLPVDAVRDRLAAAGVGTLAEAIRELFTAFANRQGKIRWGDKTPGYSMQIPLLSRLVPEARFVHVVRDGRDAAVSFTEAIAGIDGIGMAAVAWSSRVLEARREGARLGADRYRELRYEELVIDPDATVRDLCDFAALDYRPGMLEYGQAALAAVPARERAIHSNLAKPPTRGLRDWSTQMAPRVIELFEAIAGNTLTEFGYPRAYPAPSAGARLRALWIRSSVAIQRGRWHARRTAFRILRPNENPPARRW